MIGQQKLARRISIRWLLVCSYLLPSILLLVFCVHSIFGAWNAQFKERVHKIDQSLIAESRQIDLQLLVLQEGSMNGSKVLPNQWENFFADIDKFSRAIARAHPKDSKEIASLSAQVHNLKRMMSFQGQYDNAAIHASLNRLIALNAQLRAPLFMVHPPKGLFSYQQFLERAATQKLYDVTVKQFMLLEAAMLEDKNNPKLRAQLLQLQETVNAERALITAVWSDWLREMQLRSGGDSTPASRAIGVVFKEQLDRTEKQLRQFEQVSAQALAKHEQDVKLPSPGEVTLPESWTQLKRELLGEIQALERLLLIPEIFSIEIRREVSRVTLFISIFSLFFCTLLIVGVWEMLRRYVLRPMAMMTAELETVGPLAGVDLAVQQKGRDELSLMFQAVHALKNNAVHLDEQAKMLQMAESLAGLGSWHIDCRTRRLRWSAGVYKIHGLSMDEFSPTIDKALALLHPYDQEHVASLISNALVHGEAFSYEAKLIRSDGEVRTVECMGTVERDAEGRVITVLGALHDLTRQKISEVEAQRNNEELTALVDEQTADLLAAKNEAERANKMKSQFLANLSHELRTPMHAIINFSRIGINRINEWDSSKHVENLTRIRESGTRLSALLNDLLDLSKLESGNFVYSIRACDLVMVCKGVFSEVSILAHNKGIELVLEAPDPHLVLIECDRGKIYQVLYNLITNAIKFTERHGIVKLILERLTTQEVCFKVTDRGVGIPEDELHSVFDKFIQSQRTSDVIGGTGLGLAICKEIVEAHSGKIWAKNNYMIEGQGQVGATFFVVLPVAQSYKVEVEKISA